MGDRLIPAVIWVLVALALFGLMLWGWRARTRRQSAFARPATGPDDVARGRELARASVLYVATTKAGDPLDRLTIPGLAFRGRGEATVYAEGLSIAIPGEPETFVARTDIRSVGTSTWAIDRVVETGGLVRLDWTYASTDGPADVESYLRATNLGDAGRLIDAIDSIIPLGGPATSPAPNTPQQEGPSS